MGGYGGTALTTCALALSLSVAGCTNGASETITPAGGTPTTGSASTAGGGAEPLQPPPQAQGHNDEDHDHEPAEAVPTWDEASRTGALEVAGQTMRAFARPSLDEATWWDQLRPLLTPAAAIAYEGTDPANVPASAVTGAPVLVDDTSAYLARVEVPTDAGTYAVLLVREGAGQPWLAERITPPESAGP